MDCLHFQINHTVVQNKIRVIFILIIVKVVQSLSHRPPQPPLASVLRSLSHPSSTLLRLNSAAFHLISFALRAMIPTRFSCSAPDFTFYLISSPHSGLCSLSYHSLLLHISVSHPGLFNPAVIVHLLSNHSPLYSSGSS